jgi:pyruvate/2-oxoglutarate dehydrogenase complex dihydrolipoamide acyltransferase (E2) component
VFVRLPGFARRLFLRTLLATPRLVKALYGTVMVSSLGMFGRANGWALPVPNHTLQITLGGIDEKPGVVDHQVVVRKMMSVTVSFDHDIVDCAPAARFMQRLKKLVERGYQPAIQDQQI